MSVYETIQDFLKINNYLQDEHILGVLFYGSYKHGLNNQNSDIDLHIIYDDSNPEHLIRGNTFVNGIRIEYFEKTISEESAKEIMEFLKGCPQLVEIGSYENIYNVRL